MLYPALPSPVIASFKLPSYSTSVFQSEQGYRSSTLLSQVGTGSELDLIYEAILPSEAIDLVRFWTASKGSHYKFRLPVEIYQLMAIAVPDTNLPTNLFLEEFGISPYWIITDAPSIALSVITIHDVSIKLQNVM